MQQLVLGRKRKSENCVYAYIKKPYRNIAKKLIKIEIIDGDKLDDCDQICRCDAELCAQYVVKNVVVDDIYQSVRNVINRIEETLSADSHNGYTLS